MKNKKWILPLAFVFVVLMIAIPTIVFRVAPTREPKVVAISLPMQFPTETPTIAPTPTPTRKEYAGLMWVDRPPDEINRMPIPAWSNLVALYAIGGDDRLYEGKGVNADSINVWVECPLRWYLRTHKLRDPIIQGECGVILNATLNGKDLTVLKRDTWNSGSLATFSFPNGKRPKETEALVVDIWLLPNRVYQATWTLTPDSLFLTGPQELHLSLEDMRVLVQTSVSRDFELTEKVGVGLLPMSEKLRPYLSLLIAEQVGKELVWNEPEIRDDGWTFSVGHLKPGYYILRACYSVPDVRKGGLTELLCSPRTDNEFHVVNP